MVSAAVEQQNGLPALPQIFRDRPCQRHADERFAAVKIFVIHIHKPNFRHNGFTVTVQKRVVMVFSAFRHEIRFHGRGCGTQKTICFVVICTEFCDFPGMIARAAFGLIGAFLLFIHHDETQILHRRKNGRTRTDDDLRLSAAHTLPLVHALAHRKTTVENRNGIAKGSREHSERLRREGNFRHGDDDAFAPLQHMTDHVHEHRGFARPGDAV